jgi:dolichol-phosphate mannosyltransferase
MKEIYEQDPKWKIIKFSRNFGHQTAVSAGLHYSKGLCVIVIDADLQDPPEEIIHLIEKWKEGYEVVYAVRKKRKENILKRFSYKTFYRILSIISDIKIPLDTGDFCLMDRKVVDLINSMPEKNRFIRGLRAWTGFRQYGIKYERMQRAAGDSKYSLKKLVKLAIDGIFSFSSTPLRMASYLGFIVSIFAFCLMIFTFFQRVFTDYFAKIGHAPVRGFATTVILISFIGGVQLICLGTLGEYIGRIYEEVKGRPIWIIGESFGLDNDNKSSSEM